MKYHIGSKAIKITIQHSEIWRNSNKAFKKDVLNPLIAELEQNTHLAYYAREAVISYLSVLDSATSFKRLSLTGNGGTIDYTNEYRFLGYILNILSKEPGSTEYSSAIAKLEAYRKGIFPTSITQQFISATGTFSARALALSIPYGIVWTIALISYCGDKDPDDLSNNQENLQGLEDAMIDTMHITLPIFAVLLIAYLLHRKYGYVEGPTDEFKNDYPVASCVYNSWDPLNAYKPGTRRLGDCAEGIAIENICKSTDALCDSARNARATH